MGKPKHRTLRDLWEAMFKERLEEMMDLEAVAVALEEVMMGLDRFLAMMGTTAETDFNVFKCDLYDLTFHTLLATGHFILFRE